MARVALEHVHKRFADGTVALRDISLDIAEGELFVLVGPSGCGKSTLLNLLVGLDSVSDGAIRLDGAVINDLDPKDRNMAMVFQNYAIYPHMTVAQNLAFPLTLGRLPKADIERRVQEMAQLLELEPLLARRPAQLSGGQRQRVAIGRALIRKPALFALDEPLSNLDARLRVQMRHEIARLQRRLQITTVYVTHDQTEAMTLADRVAVLHQGQVQQTGTPRQLYERPANVFVARFIGAPAMNLIPARMDEGALQLAGITLPLNGQQRRWRAHDQALLAGIRAEQLQLHDAEPHWPRIRARIETVEWLGADLYAYFELPAAAADAPEAALVARLDPDASVRGGDVLEFAFDPRQLHLFDTATGARL